MHTHVSVCVCVRMHILYMLSVYMCVCIHTHLLCLYVCMYVCTYTVYVHTYLHTPVLSATRDSRLSFFFFKKKERPAETCGSATRGRHSTGCSAHSPVYYYHYHYYYYYYY